MKIYVKCLIGILIFFSCVSLFSEIQAGLTLINNVFTFHNLSNDLFESSDSWMYGGDFDAHLTVNPSLIFEENFQADALIDGYCLKPYDGGDLELAVKQAYVDLLFFDMVGLKAGFIQTDYGFNNNYFHPMDVSEFVPEFRTLYPDIYVGANNLGMPGVPSVRLKISIPEFITGLRIGLDQALIWFDFENFEKNYFISSLSVAYGNLNAGVVLGWNGDSFSSGSGVRKPVIGMNMSIGLPFKTMLLWEGVYRQESYRAFVESNNVENYRSGSFFNQSVRLDTNQVEPLFHNTITAYVEYFYYGEGFSGSGYNLVYNYLESKGTNVMMDPDYYNLIVSERNFNNYLTFGAGYLTQQKWNFSYKAVAELDSGVWQHWLTIGKAFDNVSIGGSFIYIPQTDEKYELLYGAKNLFFYFQISTDI